jgi:threonine dehydrogenase-like Zn-dependent dehydrogenase
MGDTMLGCGTCRRCRKGHQHVCEHRQEVGVRGGRPGALAEQLAVPVGSLHVLPDTVDAVLGAMVEPGGNSLRSAQAAALQPGDRALVLGPGTIGLLVAMFARAAGAEVHLLGRTDRSLDFARSLGFEQSWTEDTLPDLPFDAVIDASNAPQLPARALDLVEPAGRVVYVGLAGSPSRIDTRTLALKDVTAVGVLSASPGLAATIEAYASGAVDPRPLVAATVGLDQVGAVLAGERPPGAGPGPKIHVDPRIG